ncbi:MAG: LysR family transcriptional regulator, partial [Alphaproteobacteria bacterium]
MNLKQLRAFREVMLTGSVSKAAQNLLRTQPSISSQIASLEAELGLKLFERRRGRLHPVPEAHYLLQESQRIIDGLSRTERTMKSIRDLDRGAIRMVAMPGPSVFLLPDMISRFAKGREDVRVSLITRSSEQVQRLVSVQQYDLGLVDLGFPDMEKSPLVDHDIMTFRCVCALHRSD